MGCRKYRIADIKECANDVCLFILEPEDGKGMAFKPGQFVKIYDADKKIFRPYSIASAPGGSSGGSPNLEFAIKFTGGQFTTYLAGLKKGDSVWIEGPFGHFHYNGEPKAAFVAGGIGITPIMGMLRHIAKTKSGTGDFVLFYSARTAGDYVYSDELKRLASANPNIKVVFTLTRENPECWKGECGRVDGKMIEKHLSGASDAKDGANGRAKDYSWFMCGPMKMVLELKETLLSLGVLPEKVKFEGWG